jgi:hypothetical protein
MRIRKGRTGGKWKQERKRRGEKDAKEEGTLMK